MQLKLTYCLWSSQRIRAFADGEERERQRASKFEICGRKHKSWGVWMNFGWGALLHLVFSPPCIRNPACIFQGSYLTSATSCNGYHARPANHVFFLSVFTTLSCLTLLKNWLWELWSGKNEETEHANHSFSRFFVFNGVSDSSSYISKNFGRKSVQIPTLEFVKDRAAMKASPKTGFFFAKCETSFTTLESIQQTKPSPCFFLDSRV